MVLAVPAAVVEAVESAKVLVNQQVPAALEVAVLAAVAAELMLETAELAGLAAAAALAVHLDPVGLQGTLVRLEILEATETIKTAPVALVGLAVLVAAQPVSILTAKAMLHSKTMARFKGEFRDIR